jgi:hypothetical protein
VLLKFFLGAFIIQGVAGTLLQHEEHNCRQQDFHQGIVRFLPTVFHLAQALQQVRKKMMDRFEQFVEHRLPAARLGGGAPPGTPLGLTGGRVTCFPVLTALEGGVGALLHQGLLWTVGGMHLDDTFSAATPLLSVSNSRKNIFSV